MAIGSLLIDGKNSNEGNLGVSLYFKKRLGLWLLTPGEINWQVGVSTNKYETFRVFVEIIL